MTGWRDQARPTAAEPRTKDSTVVAAAEDVRKTRETARRADEAGVKFAGTRGSFPRVDCIQKQHAEHLAGLGAP